MKPILSLRDLSARLGIPIEHMRAIACDIASHYKTFPLIDKVNKSKVRQLTVPSKPLMAIQRRIKNNILSRIPLPGSVHGGVRDRSPSTNAIAHLGQRCVVSMDVKKFFPSVRHYMVYRMFRGEFGFGRDVASLLTRLTTLDSGLPQGAPTSTAVANLLLAKSVDEPLLNHAMRSDSRYTRFVDDIAFSGIAPRSMINLAARMLSSKRLRVYRKSEKSGSKHRIASRGSPQEITGLIVNSVNGPSVSRKRREKVRAEIFSRSKAGIDREALNSIRGKIAHIRPFNPGAAKRLERYLEQSVVVRRTAW